MHAAMVRAGVGARRRWYTHVLEHSGVGTRRRWDTQALVHAGVVHAGVGTRRRWYAPAFVPATVGTRRRRYRRLWNTQKGESPPRPLAITISEAIPERRYNLDLIKLHQGCPNLLGDAGDA